MDTDLTNTLGQTIDTKQNENVNDNPVLPNNLGEVQTNALGMTTEKTQDLFSAFAQEQKAQKQEVQSVYNPVTADYLQSLATPSALSRLVSYAKEKGIENFTEDDYNNLTAEDHALMKASIGSIETDAEKKKALDYAKTLQAQGVITKEQVPATAYTVYHKATENVMAIGAIPTLDKKKLDALVYDPNVSVATMSGIANSLNLIGKRDYKGFGTWSSAYTQASNDSDINEKYGDYKLTAQQANELNKKNELLYGSPSDGIVHGVANFTAQMWEGFKYNPLATFGIGLASAVSAPFTSGASLGVGVGAIQSIRDFNYTKQSVALNAQLENKDLSQEQALNSWQSNTAGVAMGVLDVASLSMLGKLVGKTVQKPLATFIANEGKAKKALSPIVSAPKTKSEALALESQNILKDLGKNYLENTGMALTATMTQQGAINSLAEKPLNTNMRDALKNGLAMGAEFTGLSAFGLTVKFPFTYAKIASAYAKEGERLNNKVAQTKINETTQGMNNVAKNHTLNEMDLHEVYFDKADLQQMAQEQGVDLESSWIKERMDKTPDGETVAVPMTEYLSHTDDHDFDLYESIKHDSDEGASEKESQAVFTPEQKTELENDYQDYLKKLAEENKEDVDVREPIIADVMDSVRNTVPNSNSEQARAIGSYVATVFDFLGKLANEKADALYDKVKKATFNREMTPRTTDGSTSNYRGKFNEQTKTVDVTDKGDSITALHEVMHYSLSAMESTAKLIKEKIESSEGEQKAQLEKNYQQLKSLLDEIYGQDFETVVYGSNEWRKGQESFVSRSLLDILTGHEDAEGLKDFTPKLKSMIADGYALRMRTKERNAKKAPKQKIDDAVNQVKDEYSTAIHEPLTDGDPLFNQFAKDLFEARKESEEYIGLYLSDTVDTLTDSKGNKINIADIEVGKNADGTPRKLGAEIVDKIKEEKAGFTDWLTSFRSKASVAMLAFSDTLKSQFDSILKSHKRAKEFVAKQSKEFRQTLADEMKKAKVELKETNAYKFLSDLKKAPLNESEMKMLVDNKMLTEKEYERLHNNGYIAKDGEMLETKTGVYTGMNKRTMLKYALSYENPQAYVKDTAYTNALNKMRKASLSRLDDKTVNKKFFSTFGNVLRLEHTLVQKLLGELDKTSIIKHLAYRALQDSKVYKHSDRYYLAQASRLRLKAQACLKKGDLKGANEYYRASRITAEIALQVTSTRLRLAKVTDKINKLIKRGRSDLFKKGYDNNTLDIVRVILDRTGLGSKVAIDTSKIAERAKDDPVLEIAYNIYKNEFVSVNKNFADMTTVEVEKTHNILLNLISLAKQAREIELDGKTYKREEVIDKIYNQIQYEHKVVDGKVVLVTDEKGLPVVKKQVREGRELNDKTNALNKHAVTKGIDKISYYCKANIGKIEQWIYTIDGELGGVLHTLFFTPLRRALSRSAVRADEFKTRIQNVLSKVQKSYSYGMIDSGLPDVREQGKTITFGAGSSNAYGCGQAEIMGLLLHCGNDSNFSKLCDGYGWTPQQVKDFIQNGIDNGIITKEMLEGVNELWAIYHDAFVLGDKAYYKVKGIHPKELEARPFIVRMRDGSQFTLTGGYAPIIVNKSVSVDRNKILSATQLNNLDEYGKLFTDSHPSLAEGWAKSRVENLANQPAVSFDVAELSNRAVMVATYSELAPTVHNLRLVIEHPKIKQAFETTDPDNYHAYMQRALLEACNSNINRIKGDPLNIGFINGLISSVGQSLMSMNIGVAVTQVVGLVPAMMYVKPKYLIRGLRLWGKSYKDMIDFLTTHDPFFAERLKINQSHLSESVKSLLVTTHGKGFYNQLVLGHRRITGWLSEKFAYAFLKAVQDRVDVATAYGAYLQELEKVPANMRNEQAISKALQKAEQIVRFTQSSSNRLDKAGIENANAFVKMFMQFQNYFFNVAQTALAESKRCKAMNANTKERLLRTAYATTMLIVIPSFLNGLITRTTHGDTDDLTDFSELLTMTGKESAKTLLHGFIPVVGGMFDTTIDSLGGENKKNYRRVGSGISSPTMSAISNAIDGVQALMTGDFNSRNGRDIIYVMNDVMGLGAVNPAVKRIWQASTSRETTSYDFIRMLITGYQSDKQRAKK